MYGWKSLILWLLISVSASNAAMTEFHCKPKQGCQISKCDPIPPVWFNQDISKYLEIREFPILCKPEKEAEKHADSEVTGEKKQDDIEDAALVQKISEVVDKKLASILDRLETMENRVWNLMQTLVQMNLVPVVPTTHTTATTTTTTDVGDNDASNNPSLCNGRTCSPKAQCVWRFGEGYACVCNDGYTGDGYTCKGTCNCSSNAKCISQVDGTYVCECIDGFTGDGYTCHERLDVAENKVLNFLQFMGMKNVAPTFPTIATTPIAETSSSSSDSNNNKSPCLANACSQNARCVSVDDEHYVCECNDGYAGDGFSCAKKTSAAWNNLWSLMQRAKGNEYYLPVPCGGNICSPNATCIPELDGSYTCQCNDGYSGDGHSCIEMILCKHYRPCDVRATCNQVDNVRYTCTCMQGYTGNGKKCRLIMPCEISPCHANAICTNVDFTRYKCKCKPGFTGDGKKCKELCPKCHSKAVCLTGPDGKSRCKCKAGYQGNGTKCKKRDGG